METFVSDLSNVPNLNARSLRREEKATERGDVIGGQAIKAQADAALGVIQRADRYIPYWEDEIARLESAENREPETEEGRG